MKAKKVQPVLRAKVQAPKTRTEAARMIRKAETLLRKAGVRN